MSRITKVFPLFILGLLFISVNTGFSQKKEKKPQTIKRESARRAKHSRDSILRSLNKSDTSVSSLVQRIQQYTTSFNQIKNNLSEGLDTAEVSQRLPAITKRLNKMDSLAKSHKSSTLRYLFVLRDNLDRYQDDLEGWQGDLGDINTILIQNQKDLLKFFKDTTLKTIPSDSALRVNYFKQLRSIKALWRTTDSINRRDLFKVNLIQDKVALAYTKTLDETDQIDSKIKRFAIKSISGDTEYIWYNEPQYNDFSDALKSTVKLNKLLFNYFIKTETVTHFLSLVFFVFIFSWIFFNRLKIFRISDDPAEVFKKAGDIYKWPTLSALFVGVAFTPYFYSHPPVVFLELLFLMAISVSIFFIRKQYPHTMSFFLQLLGITLVYFGSNLFVQISNIDRYAILLLSIASIIIGILFLKKVKRTAEGNFPYSELVLKIFIAMQSLSAICNITGRFSLAKIIGITAVFNLWLLVILFFTIQIIVQALYLQFQTKKDTNNLISWLDYNIVEKKFKSTLVVVGSLLWLFTLAQNLNIDDWVSDCIKDLLNEDQTVGSATFKLSGFVTFVLVIWLSSIVSKIVSYFYDVSALRATDLSVLKKKNRTSALLIRMGVLSLGFLLAVAASDFPLEKLTIIISAFGVGIGFGLQNVVNNLVSGLILAFEKPITIGDVIEVDGHTGTMKEIGIRSSKLLTGNGSEVIIPNGDLISHQVVNWTLSNSNRQIELMIVTAYGADINRVKDLIKDLLSNRDDIMTTPKPAVFLNNMNENAVEFRVLFWEADISTTNELKSRMLAEIYETLNKAEIRMPSSKKDLYLHFPEGMPASGLVKSGERDKTKE